MRNEAEDVVSVTFDSEVETPALVNTGLPTIIRLVELLRAQLKGVGDSAPAV